MTQTPPPTAIETVSEVLLIDHAVAFAEMWGTPDNWQQVRDAFTAAIKRDRAARTDDAYRSGWQDAMDAAPGMQAAKLQAAYDKVKEWPEKRMPGVDITTLGEGFTDLLQLRNLIPDTISALASRTPNTERAVKAEPVAWMTEATDGLPLNRRGTTASPEVAAYWRHSGKVIPLYASPPSPAEVTEEMVERAALCIKGGSVFDSQDRLDMARAALTAAFQLDKKG